MHSNDDRQYGIEFGEFADALDSIDYPVGNGALVEQFGAVELGVPDGETTVGAVLGRHPPETTYASAEEVRRAVALLVDDDAVGRENYTDRGGHPRRDGAEQRSL